jgi:membrane protein
MGAWSDRVPGWLRNAARPALPFYRAARLWSDAGGGRMSAAMSFYGILSLAPLVLLLVAVLGWWLDREVLETGLIAQIETVVGPRGAAVIRQALASAKEPGEGVAASLVGFAVLLTGATGVFAELQSALERLWVGADESMQRKWWHGASLRIRGVAYVLAFGFLLLISLVISTLLSLASGWAGERFALEQALRVLNEAVAFGLGAALFFGLMRMSSGPKPGWRSLVFGAVIAALLFTGGRQVLTAYLSGAAVVSAYGAAGSLVVLLMWIYFSSAVLLYGASCAKAVGEQRLQNRNRQPQPADGEEPGGAPPPRRGVRLTAVPSSGQQAAPAPPRYSWPAAATDRDHSRPPASTAGPGAKEPPRAPRPREGPERR